VPERWPPTTFVRFVRTIASSSRTTLVQTDGGPTYLKAINNPEGPHVLACDLFGTHLARRFGLRTFDVGTLILTDLDEIPLNGTVAAPGPSFVSRGEQGITMGGHEALAEVDNLDSLLWIVAFDTWVRNCDRHGPGLGPAGGPRINLDNLFLSTEAAPDGKFILKAIDHGHILTCGRPLSPRLADIDNVQDDRIYGLFPFFHGHLTLEPMEAVLEFFQDVRSHLWEDLLTLIPPEWQVSNEAKRAIDQFLLNRARYLANHFREMLMRQMPQGILDFDLVGEEEDEH
jgi:hypothetical protein